MKKYHEIASDYATPEEVLPTFKYYAYASGISYGPFDDREDAENISKNIERVLINKGEVDGYRADLRRISELVFKEWYTFLQKEHSNLNDKTFELVYSMAYDKGHSSGYDEVAGYMNDFATFAEQIIEANK